MQRIITAITAAALCTGVAVAAEAQGTAPDSALLAQGKQLVTTVCAACHTEQPPAKLAPPLAHVSHRYRMQLEGDRDAALERIVSWIKAPAKEKSLMPPMAIERFGLMAPLPLPDEQLRAAAAYVWSLSEGKHGMGMGHRR
jgi:mono/diheme cytochrome c family protein